MHIIGIGIAALFVWAVYKMLGNIGFIKLVMYLSIMFVVGFFDLIFVGYVNHGTGSPVQAITAGLVVFCSIGFIIALFFVPSAVGKKSDSIEEYAAPLSVVTPISPITKGIQTHNQRRSVYLIKEYLSSDDTWKTAALRTYINLSIKDLGLDIKQATPKGLEREEHFRNVCLMILSGYREELEESDEYSIF